MTAPPPPLPPDKVTTVRLLAASSETVTPDPSKSSVGLCGADTPAPWMRRTAARRLSRKLMGASHELGEHGGDGEKGPDCDGAVCDSRGASAPYADLLL